MTWRDQLVRASWRGTRFILRSVSMHVGRRTVVHEFPGQTLPYAEDLGRATRRWSLRMELVGSDYLAARDTLRQSFERAGPGELILPTLGAVQAVLETPVEIEETSTEGGFCRISATFVEATTDLRVAVTEDKKATASASIVAAQALLAPAFEGEVAQATQAYAEAMGQPTALEAAQAPSVPSPTLPKPLPTELVASVLDRIPGALATATGAVQGAIDKITAPVAAINALRGQVTQIQSQLATLAATPALAAQALRSVAAAAVGLATDIQSLAAYAIDPVASLLALIQSVSPAAPQTSQPIQIAVPPAPIDALERTLEQVTTALQLSIWATELEAAAIELDYATADSAAEVAAALDVLSQAAIEARSVVGPSIEMRAALSQSASMVSRYLRDVAMDLPRLSTHVPDATLPAVLLSHRLYGDATRADEIVRINRLSDPLRVPGGQPLKVVANG